ncbi:MAG: hypothetical protein M1819_006664 [Sarea resinae]|nr:MAG: hypothetical protein M1819_006664 [Sarea resinae]
MSVSSSTLAEGAPIASSNDNIDREEAPKASLDTLVAHLLASKRSLSSINHVWRANEMVTSARSALEESVILGARLGFMKRGIAKQVSVLDYVRSGLESVARDGQAEFQAVLEDLDTAEANLQQTLGQLRSTMVEAAFRPEGEEPKSLHDFVDEQGVDSLMAAFRDAIDITNDAQREFAASNHAFDLDLQSIQTTIKAAETGALQPLAEEEEEEGDEGQEGKSRAPELAIPSLLQSLESHAKEMADLLESLVRHFDLCVTAIKHTEGGGAAAQSITGDLPAGVGVDEDEQPPEPITEQERIEMVWVLSKDAEEVDDVVSEIRDRLTDMELQSERISAHVAAIVHSHRLTTAAFHLLEDVGARLPSYIAQSHTFLTLWEDQKQHIAERMEELEGLKDFYDGFLQAYDGLIIEVARRGEMQTRMEKVVQDAAAKLERLREEDLAERDAFRQDQGDYLPADIWPGLTNLPLRFEIVPLDKATGDVPELPRPVIEQALSRARSRV